MKKLLSLTLVVVMLLSTLMLTSCDEAFKILNDYMNSQTTTDKPNITTTPNDTTSSTEDDVNPEPTPNEDRYTVTDEEWADILQSNNFTYSMRIGTVVQTISKSEAVIEVKANGVVVAYYVTIDGVDYMFTFDDFDGWKREESDKTLSELETLDKCFYDRQNVYLDDFFKIAEYNEETKTYVLMDDPAKIEFYFENGKLIYGYLKSGDSEIFRIENVGTTTFEVPDFNTEKDSDGDNSYDGDINIDVGVPDRE